MTAARIRAATDADAAAICEIYNQGIEDRLATLETELRTPEERRHWLKARGPGHPVIVADDGGRVVAWGSLNPFNSREAYRHVVDFSIYETLGVRTVGIYKEQGMLDGRWVDTIVMEKLL